MESRPTDNEALGNSMLEEIRRTAERRLRQIEPLLEEAQRLQDVLKVLEAHSARSMPGNGDAEAHAQLPVVASVQKASERPSQEPSAQSLERGDRAAAPERAAKGSNKRAILELVSVTPGVTSAQIAELTGMKRTVVASTVSRLKRHGELVDYQGGGVCVPARTERASDADRDAETFGPQTPPRPATSAAGAQRTRHLAPLHRRHAA